MPNHCENKLTVIADKEVIDTIVAKHINELTDSPYDKLQLDFNTIIPYPAEHREADRKLSEEVGVPSLFSSEGYNWCVENWGTKWNSYGVGVGRPDENTLCVDFDTAWSPPLPIIGKLGEMYPNARFELEFREEGMCFEGGFICENGKVLESWSGEFTPEEEEEW